MTGSLVDIGVNLTNLSFKDDIDAVISRARQAQVNSLILTGTSLNESQAAMTLTNQYDHCFFTAGVHPHDASSFSNNTVSELSTLLAAPKAVAVGETGLDFNRNYSPQPSQVFAFEQQIELAITLDMPLFCHEREASLLFSEIIQNYRDKISKLVVHCFTADKAALHRYLDLDCHIGLTGWICDERRGTHLHPLIPSIPANRLMVETDSPYLLPRTLTPKPKNRRNEPAFLGEVIKMIALVTGKSRETVARETTETAIEFFNLDLGE